MRNDFLVKAGQFEGPFDLLLSLIERRKMHISDVSLAKVTNDYLAHIKEFDEVSTGSIAHFILTAATLMLIKSRALLPKIAFSQEETTSMEELELRLKLLQLFRSLGESVVVKLFNTIPLFTRPRRITKNEIIFSPPEKNKITPLLLLNILKETLVNLPQKENLPHITVKKMISLEETMSRLLERVHTGLKMGFHEFVGIKKKGTRISHEARQGIIVSFLAVLELARRGAFEIDQQERFGDISIQTLEVDTPRYI